MNSMQREKSLKTAKRIVVLIFMLFISGPPLVHLGLFHKNILDKHTFLELLFEEISFVICFLILYMRVEKMGGGGRSNAMHFPLKKLIIMFLLMPVITVIVVLVLATFSSTLAVFGALVVFMIFQFYYIQKDKTGTGPNF